MFDATPVLRLYAMRRSRQLARQDAAVAQSRQLLALVRQARATKFGRAHDFERIKTVTDFQARVPLRRYEDFWTEYWRDPFPVLRDISWPGQIPYFALTSGTSAGRSKYLPVSTVMNRANRRAALDVLVHHLRARPRSRILGGKNLILGASTDLRELAPGVFAGDLRGIVARTMPLWARYRALPQLRLAPWVDWEKEVRVMASASLGQDLRSVSGTPSWLLHVVKEVMALRPGEQQRLNRFYPNLELLVHGGEVFPPYRQRFTELLAGSGAEMREVYAASEGFIATADLSAADGLRLMAGNGLFFEFVPLSELGAVSPTRHWIANVELGEDYAIVLSSNAGLWAYVLGDTVRFVNRQPPRLIVTGRTGVLLSAFGEHVLAGEIESAVGQAAEAMGVHIAEFCAGALYAGRGDGVDAHLYLMEFAGSPPNESQLAAIVGLVDVELVDTNSAYAERRRNRQLASPRVEPLPAGIFASWMKRQGRLSGGQNKLPRIITDPDLFNDLRRFAVRETKP